MTYADILSLFNLKLDKETNAYFNTTEIAQILNGALYRLLEDRYRAFESSTRISEHLSNLVVDCQQNMNAGAELYINRGIDWQIPFTDANTDLTQTFPGWLYILSAKVVLIQKAQTFNDTSAVLTQSDVETEKRGITIPLIKLDIGAERINDPYLEGGFPTVTGSENANDFKLFYQIQRGGIKIKTREQFHFSNQELFGVLGPDQLNGESARVVLTVIQKPTEFNASLLAGTTTYNELTEPGIRDLIEYAIQIASEITREKEEYQFISSQIQKDLL